MKIRNGRMVLQAKDIPDEDFLAAIDEAAKVWGLAWGHPDNRRACTWEVNGILGEDVPLKVVIAKAASLIKRGLIDGCACGCRGDFEVIERPPS